MTATDPLAAIAALSAQVADLRSDVRTTKAYVERMSSTSPSKLQQQVADLARTLEELLDEGPEVRHSATNWLSAEDCTSIGIESSLETDTALDNAREDLACWVETVIKGQYPHVKLRPCWLSHPAAVWELSVLHAEWRRIYVRKHPDLPGALTWHDRYLPGVATRLAVILGDCKGTCALEAPPSYRSMPSPRV